MRSTCIVILVLLFWTLAFPGNSSATSLGNWAATTSFSSARLGHQCVSYGGYLYVLGGLANSGYAADVQYAPVNGNGTVGAWTSTTSLPSNRWLFGAVAYNGYMYVAGGSGSGGYHNDVLYAPIQPDGTIGAWANTSAFTTGRDALSLDESNGYLYIAGGYSGTRLGDVQFAAINPDGSVAPWSATTALPFPLSRHASFAYNGYLYVLGGQDGTNLLNDVLYAQLGAGGTVGAWQSTSAFDVGRFAHATVANGGYAYLMGGQIAGPLWVNDVQWAAINPDGTLSPWQATTPLPANREAFAAAVSNNRVYAAGGYDGVSMFSDVVYAPICPTITLSPSTLADGVAGAAYSQTISPSGGTAPYSFAVTAGALPVGLNLDPVSGVIDGTPAAVESASFTIAATDASGCSGTGDYTINIAPGILFSDDFEDGNADGWTWTKGNWSVVSGSLVGTYDRKTDIIGPFTEGCITCTIEADLRVQTDRGRVSLLGWYQDKKTNVEIRLMEDKQKMLIKHRVGTMTAAKKSVPLVINTNTAYHLKVSYSAGAFHVYVDGLLVASIPTLSVPSGNVGFRVKSTTGSATTGSFAQITVY